MAKLTLNDVTSGYVSTTLINSNNTLIENALENTLSRDGSGPNQMETSLDMNGNLILNSGNAIQVSGFTWEGPWITTQLYAVGDIVEYNGTAYMCIVAHTSGTFATDLLGGKWQTFATASLPTQIGNTDKFLKTDGATASWEYPQLEAKNAKAYGAIGDGVTDDTGALTAWLTACRNGAGFLPRGVYNHTGLTLDPQYSYNLYGEAYDNDSIGGSVLVNTNALGGHAITIDNTPFTVNYDSQIKISNMTIKGNALSGDGFNVDQTMVFLDSVWITGHGGSGYFAQRCYSSSFRQVSFSNNYKNGFVSSRALNAVHFDHCLFNGNALLSTYCGCLLTGATGADRNFGVTFTSCDFTGNGATLAGADTAYGLVLAYTAGVTLTGCYGESNRTRTLYSDSTASGLTIQGCFWQDSTVEIVETDGLFYNNNEHYDSGAATTTLIINSGMPTSRKDHKLVGNTFTGTVTKTLFGGATESRHFFYSSIPSAGTWHKGDIIWNSAVANGGATIGWVCITAGTPGTWITIDSLPSVYENWGDSDATLTPGSSFPTNIWQSPLTTHRTVTLATATAYSGSKFRITRTAGATGAFNLVVGTTGKNLVAGQWCDVEYTGTVWIVTAFGSL